MPALLVARSVSVSYRTPGGAPLPALSEVSFSLPIGGALGALGESGAGKSSLVRALVGALPETAAVSGSVRFGEVEVVGAPEAVLARVRGAGIALVPQEAEEALHPLRRVGGQVADALAGRGVGREERRRRAEAALGAVGLGGRRFYRAHPHELSGGERRRALLARAAVLEPRVLVADEPTAGLDPVTRRDVAALLEGFRRRGTALLLVSHDPGLVRALADEVLVLREGRVVEAGPVERVLGAPEHPYTRLLLDSVPPWPPGGLGVPTGPAAQEASPPPS